jgi:hypothetical protein
MDRSAFGFLENQYPKHQAKIPAGHIPLPGMVLAIDGAGDSSVGR